MADRKAVIKNADMAEDMQQASTCPDLIVSAETRNPHNSDKPGKDAIDCATQALEKYNIEKDRAGHCGIHQERVRQEVQPNVALRCWSQFWFLCDPRDEALHLLLPWASGDPGVQVRLGSGHHGPWSLFRALTHPPQAPSGDPARGLHTAIATAMDWSDSSGGRLL
eukprot:s689_g10.t1